MIRKTKIVMMVKTPVIQMTSSVLLDFYLFFFFLKATLCSVQM